MFDLIIPLEANYFIIQFQLLGELCLLNSLSYFQNTKPKNKKHALILHVPHNEA